MTIKARIYAPGWIDHTAIDADGLIELDENASVRTVYQKLKVPLPLRLVMTCAVNYELARPGTIIREGDVITLLFPIASG